MDKKTKTDESFFEERQKLKTFGSQLNYVMTKLDISNVRIARALNIDTSLVSRWRNGHRELKEDNPLRGKLIDYLHGELEKQWVEEERGRPAPSQEALEKFLFRSERKYPSSEQAWRAILRHMSQWQGGPSFNEEEQRRILESSPIRKASSYKGNLGLEEAVTRFLVDVALSETTCHLNLFSNQSMDWMLDNPAFLERWYHLMNYILSQGHTIDIIHSFGRSDEELLAAIEQWLPLYLSGHINSYVCPKLDSEEMPLARTLFINEGRAAIHANTVKGLESEATYRYTTGRAALTALNDQFASLLTYSKPLMHIEHQATFSEIDDVWQTMETKHDTPSQRQELILLTSELPACFLSRELLSKMIEMSQDVSADALTQFLEHNFALKDQASDYDVKLFLPDGFFEDKKKIFFFYEEEPLNLTIPDQLIAETKREITMKAHDSLLEFATFDSSEIDDFMLLLEPGVRTLILMNKEAEILMASTHPSFLRSLEQYTRQL